jgi:hypothetical protein
MKSQSHRLRYISQNRGYSEPSQVTTILNQGNIGGYSVLMRISRVIGFSLPFLL